MGGEITDERIPRHAPRCPLAQDVWIYIFRNLSISTLKPTCPHGGKFCNHDIIQIHPSFALISFAFDVVRKLVSYSKSVVFLSMNSDSEGEDKLVGGLFGPSDDEEEEECIVKYDTYERSFLQDSESDQPKLLTLALVKKHHSLWAEYVYNAARVVADMIDQNIIECRGKNCLELGAGAGLPGIMAALVGASTTVISDYGTSVDRSLIQAIDMNILSHNQYLSTGCKLVGEPYVWGNDVELLTGHTGCGKFDIIFMADLIFNR